MSKNKVKKGKLPKRIAGIKVPKEARKRAERAIEELKQPVMREMIAGAMGMAATAMAKAATPANSTHCTPDSKPEAKTDPAKPATGKSSGEQLVEIATGLAVVGFGKLFEKMQAASDAKKAESKT